jgi:septum formation protein
VVLSGVCLLEGDTERGGLAETQVTFRTLSPELIEWYLGTGEWAERAGAYAIQGHGAALVERIDGDYWNVVGLPVPLLLELAPELVVSGA